MDVLAIAQQIAELTRENNKGSDALYTAEVELAEAEHNLDTVEAKAFMRHQGSVADRQALARLEAADARLQRDLAKARVNRIRTKIKAIESALMASATQAKLIQSEMKL